MRRHPADALELDLQRRAFQGGPGGRDEDRRLGVELEPGQHEGQLVAQEVAAAGAVVLARAGARWSVAGPAGQVDLDEVARLGETAPEAPEGACVAPLPGLVVAVTVEEGAPVARGEVVAVLEAMKLEHRITAPVTGQVAMVLVAPGEQVGPGQVLVQLTPANDLQ